MPVRAILVLSCIVYASSEGSRDSSKTKDNFEFSVQNVGIFHVHAGSCADPEILSEGVQL